MTYQPATPDAAYALRMDRPGLPVMARCRLITNPAGNIPLVPRTNYIPELPADSPLARPAVLPDPWTDDLAAYTPHQPAAGASHIRIRPASRYEASALYLSPGRHRAMATRYDKLSVRYQAVLEITAINEWLLHLLRNRP